jgi:hypothetical protein
MHNSANGDTASLIFVDAFLVTGLAGRPIDR